MDSLKLVDGLTSAHRKVRFLGLGSQEQPLIQCTGLRRYHPRDMQGVCASNGHCPVSYFFSLVAQLTLFRPPRPLKQTIQNIQSYAFTAAPDSSKTSGSSGSGPAFASSGVKPGGTGGVVSIVKPGSTARARF